LNRILGMYGAFIVERNGTDIDDALASLQPYKDNIYVISQLIQVKTFPPFSIVVNLTALLNDVSSTKIRLFLRREMRYVTGSRFLPIRERLKRNPA
jgi:nicotinamide mononucleotide adenylyltransferase